jgi:hypothetical protein
MLGFRLDFVLLIRVKMTTERGFMQQGLQLGWHLCK